MTIDSNILIALLDKEPAVLKYFTSRREHGCQIFLPTVTEAEVLTFTQWTAEEREEVVKYMEQNFISVPFDRTLARISADVRIKARTKLPDAAIAATALYTNTPLVTRDENDFKRIAGLQIIKI